MTATESPRLTPPVLMAAPRPAITPQPISPAASGLAAGSTFTACQASTSVNSQNAPMPNAGDSGAPPSASVIFCCALRLAKQYQGRPRQQERQFPQGARQARMTKSPGPHIADAVAHLFHNAGRLVSQQKRKLVVNGPLAVMQVGVAHAARLHPHQRLARPGLRHQYRRQLHRRPLAPRDDPLHFVNRHRYSLRKYPSASVRAPRCAVLPCFALRCAAPLCAGYNAASNRHRQSDRRRR